MPENTNGQPRPSRTLVITRTTFFDIDKIVAAIVLGKILAQRHHNQVDLYFGEKLPLGPITSIVAPQDVNFREKLSPDFFTVSIPRGNAKIKEVKWEESGADLKLIIYTDQGQIDPDHHTLTAGIPQYDFVYTLGIKTREEALNALGEFSSIWQSTHTFNLDIRAENQRYAEKNHIYADSRSFAECVFKFAQENEIEITNTEATELLACIYWKTNSLRNKYTTFDTLGAVQQLIQKGGSVADAVSRIFSTLSVVEVRARQDIYRTMKLTSEKVAFAQVSPETARQLSKIQPINPEKNPLFKLKDAVTSFVMVPLSEKSTLVLCSSRDETINIKKLFSNYNFVGDPLQAELVFNLNIADTEKEIKKVLQKVFPQNNPPKEQPRDMKPSQPEVILTPAAIESKPAVVEDQPVQQKTRLEVINPTPVEAPIPEEPVFETDVEESFDDEPDAGELAAILPTETEVPAVDPFTPVEQPINMNHGEVPTAPLQPEAIPETATTADPLPESDDLKDMVMVEVPPHMGDLGPADPLPSAN